MLLFQHAADLLEIAIDFSDRNVIKGAKKNKVHRVWEQVDIVKWKEKLGTEVTTY